jgi:hypothetical protein
LVGTVFLPDPAASRVVVESAASRASLALEGTEHLPDAAASRVAALPVRAEPQRAAAVSQGLPATDASGLRSNGDVAALSGVAVLISARTYAAK